MLHDASLLEKMLQKTRVASVVDSMLKANSNMNKTMIVVGVMNMQCSSLEDIVEVNCDVIAPAATETMTFLYLLVFTK